MGKMKVVMKRIENKSSRQVTFSKRRNGVVKKARELAVLCDADVALLVISARGKRYHFCSTNSLANILDRYCRKEGANESQTANEKESEQHQQLYPELLQMVHSKLEGPTVEQLSVNELQQLEDELENKLSQTRERKVALVMENMRNLKEKVKSLKEKNEHLHEKIAAAEMKMTSSSDVTTTKSLINGTEDDDSSSSEPQMLDLPK